MAKVSIIIPCYNSGRYLREAVESALQQTLHDVEVIVVDDGSTERHTLQILELVAQQERVKLLHQKNQGPSSARNFGIRESTGHYFLPLDADDLIEPNYVSDALDVLESTPQVGIVYCQADFIGDLEGPWNLPAFSWRTILIHNLIFSASVFRKADWQAVGGYDEAMRVGREDHDFILRILGLGRSAHKLTETYFHYRRYAGTRNDIIGQSRANLVQASARMFRNNTKLYADHAEDLFEFIFEQQDQIADLRYRYMRLEGIRTRFPTSIERLKRIRGIVRKVVARFVA